MTTQLHPLLKPGYVGKLKNGLPYRCYATDAKGCCPIHGAYSTTRALLSFGIKRVRTNDPLPAPPKLVPLEARDVPPGSVLSRADWAKGTWDMVVSVTSFGIYTAKGNAGEPVQYRMRQWQALQRDGWLIKRPDEDWTRCEKEERK